MTQEPVNKGPTPQQADALCAAFDQIDDRMQPREQASTYLKQGRPVSGKKGWLAFAALDLPFLGDIFSDRGCLEDDWLALLGRYGCASSQKTKASYWIIEIDMKGLQNLARSKTAAADGESPDTLTRAMALKILDFPGGRDVTVSGAPHISLTTWELQKIHDPTGGRKRESPGEWVEKVKEGWLEMLGPLGRDSYRKLPNGHPIVYIDREKLKQFIAGAQIGALEPVQRMGQGDAQIIMAYTKTQSKSVEGRALIAVPLSYLEKKLSYSDWRARIEPYIVKQDVFGDGMVAFEFETLRAIADGRRSISHQAAAGLEKGVGPAARSASRFQNPGRMT